MMVSILLGSLAEGPTENSITVAPGSPTTAGAPGPENGGCSDSEAGSAWFEPVMGAANPAAEAPTTTSKVDTTKISKRLTGLILFIGLPMPDNRPGPYTRS